MDGANGLFIAQRPDTPMLTASKSTRGKQLSAAVSAKVNSTINATFTCERLQGLDNGITSGQTGPSCVTANHRHGGDLIFAATCLGAISLSRSQVCNALLQDSSLAFPLSEPTREKQQQRGLTHKNYSCRSFTATVLLLQSPPLPPFSFLARATSIFKLLLQSLRSPETKYSCYKTFCDAWGSFVVVVVVVVTKARLEKRDFLNSTSRAGNATPVGLMWQTRFTPTVVQPSCLCLRWGKTGFGRNYTTVQTQQD